MKINFRHFWMSLFLSISLLPLTSQSAVSADEVPRIFRALQDAYAEQMITKGEKIDINRKIGNFDWWDLPLVHASYVQTKDEGHITHVLTMVGGLFRLPTMDQDSAALILCHELGHGLGGAPLKRSDEGTMISTEGQSDYYSAKECLPRMWRQLPQRDFTVLPEAQRQCQERFRGGEPYQHCLRTFAAIRGFLAIFNDESGKSVKVSFEERDPSIASELDLSGNYYPSTQCRVDTLIAGALQLPRPACWYPPNLH